MHNFGLLITIYMVPFIMNPYLVLYMSIPVVFTLMNQKRVWKIPMGRSTISFLN